MEHNPIAAFDLTDYPSAESYTIRGNYRVTGNKLTGEFTILKGTGTEAATFRVNGSIQDKEGFCRQVAENLLYFLKEKESKK